MINIPIYRAKALKLRDRQEFGEYVVGDYISLYKSICKVWERKSAYIPIDPMTLATHFPDMIDSEGNKIFASLSEDGKGGDILIEPMFEKKQIVCKMNASGYVNKYIDAAYSDYEVIGVQE